MEENLNCTRARHFAWRLLFSLLKHDILHRHLSMKYLTRRRNLVVLEFEYECTQNSFPRTLSTLCLLLMDIIEKLSVST
jgi:hypothetical protein